MDEAQFLWNFLSTIGVLAAFVAVVSKFTKPISDLKETFNNSLHDLTLVIHELKICIDGLKESNNVINRRLKAHGEEIDSLDKRVQDLETKMRMYHSHKEE